MSLPDLCKSWIAKYYKFCRWWSRFFAQGFRISMFQEEQVNLETAFMRLTQGLVQ